jgi:hypothetical protein
MWHYVVVRKVETGECRMTVCPARVENNVT